MPSPVLKAEAPDSLSDDPRRQLVERIVASQVFVKSDRLCNFLSYICELSLDGREDEINEVNIGIRLFGRPDFDPSIDGIVRSHASRMRQRLDQYYEAAGSEEPIRLTIPKGTYVPVFAAKPIALELEPEPEPAENEVVIPPTPTPESSSPSRRAIWVLSGSLVLCCITIALLLVMLHQGSGNSSASRTELHPLWATLFSAGHHTTVVCSDTSVAVLQDLTQKPVNLSDYLSGNYRMDTSVPIGTTSDVLRDLAGRRYTAVADVGILLRFYKLPGIPPDRIQFRYARDLSPDVIKDGSAVLIGSAYSDPWVRPFESHMNFVFRDDPRQHLSSIINRSPKPDELPQYDYSRGDTSQKVYAVVAFQPNLQRSGNILILEGTSMAGTEAAADFVFDDALLLPFLKSIANKNNSIPYFEVLLQSTSMNGSSSQVQILGYRVYSD
jgi:hypothetical protein